ncbi:shikimate dehydrogenase [Thermococcus henrietii]|uniref:shikimate dehydrogenase n=1 Tax=Thermococcus henrietii TaxID=2016361 RepID=UPI000C073320|nr:shikimate dehydrogenase [Thermococcus henrietii]
MDAETRLYGVIGFPVRHSLSPAMHNAAFRELGINAVYLAFEVPPERLGMAVDGVRGLGVKGLNVTMPHKTAVMEHIDGLSGDAEEIGSVNTIVNEGELLGYNTDGIGARRALEMVTRLEGKDVLVLGAGGAGRAIAYELSKTSNVVVLNRTPGKARALERFGVIGDALTADNLRRYIREADILINATSVGMNSDESPVPADLLREGLVVMDVVYKPLRTRLLREAAERGCVTVDGLWMLVHQGAESFRLWTGKKVDPELMRGAALEGLRKGW